jgi:hypothetical protein
MRSSYLCAPPTAWEAGGVRSPRLGTRGGGGGQSEQHSRVPLSLTEQHGTADRPPFAGYFSIGSRSKSTQQIPSGYDGVKSTLPHGRKGSQTVLFRPAR